eukprot:TRINITY_DN62942_c0_g1_i1.p1 TRINITY_DN62942_c0_g1~~TRINITY_DN62942_c0_g1_i1.p1  ORF type:complete len:655 (+),score=87.78 TRINITY_DN62942_c0_g1_i1:75-2039(+)
MDPATPSSSSSATKPEDDKKSMLYLSETKILSAEKPKAEALRAGNLFSRETQSLVYNFKPQAVQRMLDFDFVIGREQPSVAGLIKPGSGGFHKAFSGQAETLIPVYNGIQEAAEQHPNATVFINFASQRSAFQSSMQALEVPTLHTIVIIAEGVPEQEARQLIRKARDTKKVVLGPGSIGGIQAGAFKIGDTAGTVENCVAGRLYRPGSVGFVSKSGGMSNEMYNVLSRVTNGIYEGIAIGGEGYPCSTFIDHIRRFQAISEIKMIVLLGELGGDEEDEYAVAAAVKSGEITKPVCAWVSGTCAALFKTEIQFGHAGARGGGPESESAAAKNRTLREAGVLVPNSYEGFEQVIAKCYQGLVEKGTIVEKTPRAGYQTADKAASALFSLKTRRGSNFISTISDDRGEEPSYAGTPISRIVEDNAGVGHVVCLLWFKKNLPKWATKFVELIIVLTADHGPCVSGAHNTIVASRAGKDLVSSLCSGLLTIGPRFGGAIDEAARTWKMGVDKKISAFDLVELKKKKGEVISGIGHRVKTVFNPDKRVEILKQYAKTHFPGTTYLNYAMEVENITTKKANNLILNVDGTIAAMFLDMFLNCENVSPAELDEIVDIGALNGLFVFSRTIGLIGHTLDQKRLKQGLYRHPWDDVLYLADQI